MKKRILWIDDDYYHIKGLLYPLEKAGFEIDFAVSATQGYQKASNWEGYDLILVDLILPISSQEENIPDEIKAWKSERFVGIGLLKWLQKDMKVNCPVVVLSVISDPISRFDLEDLNLAGCLAKSALRPSDVKKTIFQALKIPLINDV
jgi:CheY-like chemotaxis protein